MRFLRRSLYVLIALLCLAILACVFFSYMAYRRIQFPQEKRPFNEPTPCPTPISEPTKSEAPLANRLKEGFPYRTYGWMKSKDFPIRPNVQVYFIDGSKLTARWGGILDECEAYSDYKYYPRRQEINVWPLDGAPCSSDYFSDAGESILIQQISSIIFFHNEEGTCGGTIIQVQLRSGETQMRAFVSRALSYAGSWDYGKILGWGAYFTNNEDMLLLFVDEKAMRINLTAVSKIFFTPAAERIPETSTSVRASVMLPSSPRCVNRWLTALIRPGPLAWSRDGREVAFASSDGLYTVRTDGTGGRILLRTKALMDEPSEIAWLMNGRIAAVGQNKDIVLVMSKWSALLQSIFPSSTWGVDTIKTDEKLLGGVEACTLASDGSSAACLMKDRRVLLVSFNTLDQTSIEVEGRVVALSLSPRGTHLAYIIDDDNLYLCSIHGERQKLFTGENWLGELRWSTDGQILVFISNGILCMANVLNRDVKRLTQGPGWSHELSWIPNIHRLAFLSNSTGRDEIYSADTDQGIIYQFTNFPGSKKLLSCSPNGRRIMFVRVSSKGEDLYILDVKSLKLKLVAEELCRIEQASWSPNSQQIVYTAWDGREANSGYHLYLAVIPETPL